MKLFAVQEHKHSDDKVRVNYAVGTRHHQIMSVIQGFNYAVSLHSKNPVSPTPKVDEI